MPNASPSPLKPVSAVNVKLHPTLLTDSSNSPTRSTDPRLHSAPPRQPVTDNQTVSGSSQSDYTSDNSQSGESELGMFSTNKNWFSNSLQHQVSHLRMMSKCQLLQFVYKSSFEKSLIIGTPFDVTMIVCQDVFSFIHYFCWSRIWFCLF